MRFRNVTLFAGGVGIVAMLTIGAVNYHDSVLKKEDMPPNTIEYTVNPGDTLWIIAEDYTPAGTDIRETIFQIKEANPEVVNGLSVGQKLKIEVGGEKQ